MIPEVNQAIQLTATPTPNTVFTHWSGACTGTSPTCVVNFASASTFVGAHFVTKQMLTVTVTGSGAVVSEPAGIDCGTTCTALFNPGALITLTARPNPGNDFAGWTGPCAVATASCTVTMNQMTFVSAAFRATPPPPPSGGGGGGSLDWRLLGALLALLAIRIQRSRRQRIQSN
jgi:hypothetical protein